MRRATNRPSLVMLTARALSPPSSNICHFSHHPLTKSQPLTNTLSSLFAISPRRIPAIESPKSSSTIHTTEAKTTS
ncbi:hypothetical protein VTL71DRAFT_14339 [Oculimacula yallundae]|uniref:Uncharacterized protein n=1 Tax=Oculimacula yallundae TaxID=86028 RepID=A0ABR4CI59_9HELO